MARIHVLLDEAEKVRYRQAAEEKLATAGARARIESLDDLLRFFESCDAREQGREPDWAEHRRLIERSRVEGLEVT